MLADKQNRMGFIDGLRALLILVIVLHHVVCSGNFWGCNLGDSFYGSYAVSFFFVLSGFCLELKYERQCWNLKAYCRYFIRRVARLWPLHAILLAIVIGFRLPSSGSSAWVNLLLLQSWSTAPSEYFGYNCVSWFASSILACYAVFPLASRAFGSMLVLALIMHLYGWHSPAASYALFHPCFHLIEVMIGIASRRLLMKCSWRQGRVAGTTVEIVAAATLLLVPSSDFSAYGFDLRYLVWAVACGGGLVVLAKSKGGISRLLSLKPLVLIGGMSFEIFLWHVIVRICFENSAFCLGLPLCLRFPVYMVIVFGLSWFSHKVLVLPVSKWIEEGCVRLVRWGRERCSCVEGVGVVLIAIATLLALLGYRNLLTEVPWQTVDAVVKTDGTKWARGDVFPAGALLHPGEAPTALTVPVPLTADVVKLGCRGVAGGDVLARFFVDGEERLARRVQGGARQLVEMQVKGAKELLIEVDKNGQLSNDGVAIDGPYFYRKANVL